MNLLQALRVPAAGRRSARAFGAVGVALAALLAACGGGGGGEAGSTASNTPTASTGSAYAQGAVSGFGSVIVGGVRYDDSKASVVAADGSALTLGKLGLGTMVQVEAASVDRASATGVASVFRVWDEVQGPVSAVDTAAGTLTVLGQTVVVNSSTVFDSTLGSLSAALVGQVVEVHGSADTNTGKITATRLESATGATFYAVRGAIASLNTTAKTFKINAATISYAGLASSALPAVGLSNGLVVRVKLATTAVSGVWTATALGTESRTPPSGSTDVHIEGVISAWSSATSFTVGSTLVDARSATFPDGTSGIVLGARVEVTGAMSGTTLVATKVELDDKPSSGGQRLFELHGAITAIDTTAKTFVLKGITVAYGSGVTYTGGAATDLAVGKNVDVYGTLSTDRKTLTATKIVFRSSSSSTG